MIDETAVPGFDCEFIGVPFPFAATPTPPLSSGTTQRPEDTLAATAPIRRRSGKRLLRAAVVRVYPDHRTKKARQYAQLFAEISEGYVLTRETARMVSMMALTTQDILATRGELEGLAGRGTSGFFTHAQPQ
jgi:hypothetical protein